MSNNEKYAFETKLPSELPLKETEHFNIYYYPESFAANEIEQIAVQREKAYSDIASYLNADKEMKVDLFLFNDAMTKETETNHRGAGWAFGKVMVEIYNETTKCHPYHELVHVFADEIYGETVSFFSEGLAVFISNNLLNKDFGDYVNYNIHDKVATFYKENTLFTLSDMFLLEIGESTSKPKISYPQAGSLVGYIYNHLGKIQFFELYKSLKVNYSPEGQAKNISELEKYCSMSVEQIYNEWMSTIV